MRRDKPGRARATEVACLSVCGISSPVTECIPGPDVDLGRSRNGGSICLQSVQTRNHISPTIRPYGHGAGITDTRTSAMWQWALSTWWLGGSLVSNHSPRCSERAQYCHFSGTDLSKTIESRNTVTPPQSGVLGQGLPIPKVLDSPHGYDHCISFSSRGRLHHHPASTHPPKGPSFRGGGGSGGGGRGVGGGVDGMGLGCAGGSRGQTDSKGTLSW
jgi:hypothetical protein